jgi:ZIP family zinc transporter
LTALLYTIVPVLAALLGGAMTALYPPSGWLRSVVQHLAGGVVFSAAAVEILPDVMNAHAPLPAFIGSVLGIAAMVLLQSADKRLRGPIGLTFASVVDVFIDGFVLGLSFLHGVRQGLLLTIALTLELLFLGLSVAAGFGRGSKMGVIAITACVAFALPIGTAVGLSMGGLSPHILGGFYAFGLIALLYLVTEELLKEAHKMKDTEVMPIAFFAGFVGLMFLDQLL